MLTTEGLGGVVRGDGLLGKTEVGEARMAHLGSSSSSSSSCCCSSWHVVRHEGYYLAERTFRFTKVTAASCY